MDSFRAEVDLSCLVLYRSEQKNKRTRMIHSELCLLRAQERVPEKGTPEVGQMNHFSPWAPWSPMATFIFRK